MSMNGDLVHFVLPDGPEHAHGQCRPALVVHDWHEPAGTVNLVVFRDGYNDRRILAKGDKYHPSTYDESVTDWVTSILHAYPKEFGTWHTAEECGADKGDSH